MSDSPAAVIDRLNHAYSKVHTEFENLFWASKMDLKSVPWTDAKFTAANLALRNFAGSKENLQLVQRTLQTPNLPPHQRKVLKQMERTFQCYQIQNPEAAALQEKIVELEAALERKRNNMKLGFHPPEAPETFVEASAPALGMKMRNAPDEATRKACYDALLSIGPFIINDFVEIIKLRARFAHLMGYSDFYDYKVQMAEGFTKQRLFGILDDLVAHTAAPMDAAYAHLVARYGPDAARPWNAGHAYMGDSTKEQDPYFPFAAAPLRWATSMARIGVHFRGGQVNLDLCDRPGKYSNGFCHWPVCAHFDNGKWVPSLANFTSLAIPTQVGSGERALATLMHEGGHALHMANITQDSPFFAQERAPMSVPYAETQSMFMEELMNDADWLARYAISLDGKPMPWEIFERRERASRPYLVFQIRGMLRVPYFEKAIYELPESEVTAERVLALANEVDQRLLHGLSGRPTIAIPHFLSDESAAYYHAYIMAELAVHQTRRHFKRTYGRLTDEPRVGEDICQGYWRPGSGENYLTLVEKVTGEPFSSDAYVEMISQPIDAYLAEEHAAYDRALATAAPAPPRSGPGSLTELLRMNLRFVHGDTVISAVDGTGAAPAAPAASAAEGDATALRVPTPQTAVCPTVEDACDRFAAWTRQAFPAGASAL